MGKRKGLQTVSGTDSFRVSSPSVEVFAGGAGGGSFLQKAPSSVPPPAKTSTGGEAARQKFRCVERKERAAHCFLYIFFCWRGAAECHSSIHPFEIFRGKLFQNCPAATSNTGQRTPVTVRKMKRKRPEPNAGFRPFPASKAPLAGEPSHPSIRRRSLPAWRVPRSHGGFAWRRLRPR